MSRLLGFGDNQYRLYEGGEMPSLSETKLNKLLFYTDFLHYKSYARGISGLRGAVMINADKMIVLQ